MHSQKIVFVAQASLCKEGMPLLQCTFIRGGGQPRKGLCHGTWMGGMPLLAPVGFREEGLLLLRTACEGGLLCLHTPTLGGVVVNPGGL